ncbi:MAG TPA: CarD family transcriptional regulator [Ureibacillus sp.]|nr:CarD family transcriptional regulator [Ureibacillus sp.]
MFNIGDTIIYSSHGLCQIDGISEKTFSGVTKTYYVLHPLNNEKLEISTPVDNKTISTLMEKKEAKEILNLFTQPGVDWIEKGNQRTQAYSSISKKGDRKEIAKVINTLLVKKHELEGNERKFPEQDRKLLVSMQSILFSELALALDVTTEKISENVHQLLGIDEVVMLTVE